MKSIREAKVAGKKVLLRADLDGPVRRLGEGSGWESVDEAGLEATLPTIRFLVKKKAKTIIIGHLNRPGGKVVESLRLDPVAEKLSEYLKTVRKVDDCIGANVKTAVAAMGPGDILLLENLRFHPQEQHNDPSFAKKLASLADLYVNDCFPTSHRDHASISGIPKFLPAYAGFGLQKEVKLLQRILVELKHPLVVILGGAKKDKLSLLPDFLKMADFVLVGGKLIKFQIFGDREKFETVIWGRGEEDIDEETRGKFTDVIKTAKSVIWSGPMGKFEEGFVEGTRAVAEAVVASGAKGVVGGGDTEAILDKLGLIGKIDYVSPAGGAMLTFLAGRKLPGLEALNFYS